MTSNKETAEARFGAAFERLKANSPIVVAVGTPVSQNNVALEAGTDTTALRKSRYPTLVKAIQDYVSARDAVPLKAKHGRQQEQRAREEDSDRADRMQRERDIAQSKLNAVQDKLIETLMQVKALRVQLNDRLPPPSPLRP